MAGKKQAIVVETDNDLREMYVTVLELRGFATRVFEGEDDTFQLLPAQILPQVALVHFSEEPRRSLEFISRLHSLDPTIAIVFLTGYDKSHRVHKEAVSSGAFITQSLKDISPFSAEFGNLLDQAFAWSVEQKRSSNSEVFVIMPFDEDLKEIYQLAIKEPLNELHLLCQRADEIPIPMPSDIRDEIFRRIRNAEIVIADLSRPNPNVYFETGYAHALGKTIILLTATADDIPFDVLWYKHIVYNGSIVTLRDELRKTVIALGDRVQ